MYIYLVKIPGYKTYRYMYMHTLRFLLISVVT